MGTMGTPSHAAPETPRRPALFTGISGARASPPIVILHGMLGSSRNWQTAGRDLAAEPAGLRPRPAQPRAVPPRGLHELRGDGGRCPRLAGRPGDRQGRPHRPQHGGKVAMLLACRQSREGGPARRRGHRARRTTTGRPPGRVRGDERARPRRPQVARGGRDPDRGARARLGDAQVHRDQPRADPRGGWRWQINLAAITAALPGARAGPARRATASTGPRFSSPARSRTTLGRATTRRSWAISLRPGSSRSPGAATIPTSRPGRPS
jgi:esterase